MAGAWPPVLALLAAGVGAASAQTVVLSGTMGENRALLLIDGTPQTIAVGDTARGVTLERLAGGEATVRVAGQRVALRLGGSPARLGGAAAPASGGVIVLPVASGGHFLASGSINGKPVRFMVDTGATTIAMSQSQADSIGLDWRAGQPSMVMTANGVLPVRELMLASVRIGDVEVSRVAATVGPAEMPIVLLGNSFLSRFTMRRESDVMRLERKP